MSHLSGAQAEALHRENALVLSAVQASLGCISPDVRAVFVQQDDGTAVLHIVVAEGREAACAEDIEDFVAELNALVDFDTDVRVDTQVESIPRDWFDRGWRGIYWAKGWEAWKDID